MFPAPAIRSAVAASIRVPLVYMRKVMSGKSAAIWKRWGYSSGSPPETVMKRVPKPWTSRIYLDCGEKEGPGMVAL